MLKIFTCFVAYFYRKLFGKFARWFFFFIQFSLCLSELKCLFFFPKLMAESDKTLRNSTVINLQTIFFCQTKIVCFRRGTKDFVQNLLEHIRKLQKCLHMYTLMIKKILRHYNWNWSLLSNRIPWLQHFISFKHTLLLSTELMKMLHVCVKMFEFDNFQTIHRTTHTFMIIENIFLSYQIWCLLFVTVELCRFLYRFFLPSEKYHILSIFPVCKCMLWQYEFAKSPSKYTFEKQYAIWLWGFIIVDDILLLCTLIFEKYFHNSIC